MNICDAVRHRRSIRAFRDAPVEMSLLRSLLDGARYAPSGGNLQPWHATVLTGTRLTKLRAGAQSAMRKPPGSESPEYRIYPADLPDPYRARRSANGEAMFAAIGVAREDKAGRARHLARNFDFFGAPVGMLVHTPKLMGPPQWADLGMWLQSFMLLAAEAGLGTCAQESWSVYPETVKVLAEIPADHTLFCGVAIGWPLEAESINSFQNSRADLTENVRFLSD